MNNNIVSRTLSIALVAPCLLSVAPSAAAGPMTPAGDRVLGGVAS